MKTDRVLTSTPQKGEMAFRTRVGHNRFLAEQIVEMDATAKGRKPMQGIGKREKINEGIGGTSRLQNEEFES